MKFNEKAHIAARFDAMWLLRNDDAVGAWFKSLMQTTLINVVTKRAVRDDNFRPHTGCRLVISQQAFGNRILIEVGRAFVARESVRPFTTIAANAVQQLAKLAVAPALARDPLTIVERRLMAHVLMVCAVKNSVLIPIIILSVADDRPFHCDSNHAFSAQRIQLCRIDVAKFL